MDGDADRLGVVDNLGKIIYPDQYMSLLADHVLKENPGRKVILDIYISKTQRINFESKGIPVMTRTDLFY